MPALLKKRVSSTIDDIYKIVSSYVIEELKDDDEFKNRVLSNMVSSGEISRSDCIELLYDQGVLVKDGDEDYRETHEWNNRCPYIHEE